MCNCDECTGGTEWGEDWESEAEWGCVCCGGPLIYLGRLGKRDHLRCRDCGFVQTRPDASS